MPSYRLRATCPPGTRISSVRHSGDRQKTTTSNSNSSSPSTSSSANHSQHYQHATNSAHSSASTSRSNSDDFLSRAGASCGVIFEEKQKSSGSHKMDKVRESPPVVGKKIVRWQ